MRRLVILLAALLYTSTVKSSLPFFGPGGMEYEVTDQTPPQIEIEEKKEVDEVEHKDRTVTELDEDEEEENEGKEIVEPKEETQTDMAEKDWQEEGKKVGSKETVKHKGETRREMEEKEEEGEEGDMDDEDGGAMYDEEEQDTVQGEEEEKERHQHWKEMGNKDMDAEESEESRRLELKPGTKSRGRSGGGAHHGNRGRGRSGQFPYVAYVELIQCKCTGFLLTDRWILTSSHCFLVDPLFRNLQAGRVYMGTNSVPVPRASLRHVQLRIISEVKILPSEGEEPKGVGMHKSAMKEEEGGGDYLAVEGEEDRREGETPCGLSNKAQGPMQESRRCGEVRAKHRGRGRSSLESRQPFGDGDQDPPLEQKEEKDVRRNKVGGGGGRVEGRTAHEDAPGEKTDGGDETADEEAEDENAEDSYEEDEEASPGQQERTAGSGELALVKVDDKFEMNKYVGFIHLIKLPFPGSLECKAIGFVGDKSTGERKRLRWQKLEVWNGTKCNFIHRLALDKDSLCSQGPKGRPGCSEDIGGPVVCLGGAAAALMAYSLSERGATAIYDCQKRVTNVFVMGGAHLPWIQSIVRDLPLPVDPPHNRTAPVHISGRSFTGPDYHDGRSGGVTTTTFRIPFSLTSGSSGLSGVLVGCCFLLHRHI